jgi:hypothetical protein
MRYDYDDDIISKHVYLNQGYKDQFRQEMESRGMPMIVCTGFIGLAFMLFFGSLYGFYSFGFLVTSIVAVIFFLVFYYLITKMMVPNAIRRAVKEELDLLFNLCEIEVFSGFNPTYEYVGKKIRSEIEELNRAMYLLRECDYSRKILFLRFNSLSKLAKNFGLL